MIARPDPGPVLAGLKDFQRRTVDYVFERLYGPDASTHRFLVADEVGLGKTLVARGVTALAIDHLWDSTPRIDVIYVCSNASIARQNINRLNVTGEDDYAIASRITMLPLDVANLQHNKLNFLSLTPRTSFDLRSSMGIAKERALLHRLLVDHWSLHGAAPLNVLQGDSGPDSFRNQVARLSDSFNIDEELAAAFHRRLDQNVAEAKAAGRPDVQTRFQQCMSAFARFDSHVSSEDRRLRARVIGELRALLASACLRALEPDLIILDEFQRFKHLLSDDAEEATFARELFDYEEHEAKARVLLLSATPYKMYTVQDEANAENHYDDFVQTLRFLLHGNDHELAQCASLIDAYRRGLESDGGNRDAAVVAVRELERRLLRVMVRTERLAQSADRNGMLVTVPATVELQADDVSAFVRLQKVADHLEQDGALEYWKSSPYLLNFMEEYELKTQFDRALDDPARVGALARLVGSGERLLLPMGDLERYAAIPDANARLRWVRSETIDKGLWRLLWIPPSLPYYGLGGVFAGDAARDATKFLVFSSWHVVPRAVAALLSYEAERLMITSNEAAPTNTVEARRGRRPLLRFTFSDDRLGGLPLFLLLYPSHVLAEAGDFVRAPAPTSSSTESAIAHVLARIEDLLVQLPEGQGADVDEAWYWLAPVLLDLRSDRATTEHWLRSNALAAEEDTDAGEEGTDGGISLAQRALEQLRMKVSAGLFGRRPPDLAHVLALAAIGAPGVVAFRALGRLVGLEEERNNRRTAAAQIARGFRSLFNQPEVMALIRGLDSREPYWERVLEYCVDGCLSSVMEEYAHVQRESLGLLDAPASKLITAIGAAIRDSMTLRRASVAADALTTNGGTLRREAHRDARMRMHFAARFGEDPTDDGTEKTRRDQVRAAFNSPFWPFVLVTTSVGQEGLDFHPYSHAVVHWNLPANPVDFEQREGRVHRYKGHAVRKNVAQAGGFGAVAGCYGDPWARLFEKAVSSRAAGATDIVPYWVYTQAGGAQIQRHVPTLPLSRDVVRLERLRRSLVLYRLVFGQPRQEDLLAHLMNEPPSAGVDARIEALRIDLSPPPPAAEVPPG